MRPLREESYSGSFVFFTMPLRVANSSRRPSVYSFRSITALIFSSPSRATPGRFAAYMPRAVRPDSGISCALTRYTRPLVVKNSIQWWVVVVNTCFTTSSSLRFCPRTPLPPRCCFLNASSGSRFT